MSQLSQTYICKTITSHDVDERTACLALLTIDKQMLETIRKRWAIMCAVRVDHPATEIVFYDVQSIRYFDSEEISATFNWEPYLLNVECQTAHTEGDRMIINSAGEVFWRSSPKGSEYHVETDSIDIMELLNR